MRNCITTDPDVRAGFGSHWKLLALFAAIGFFTLASQTLLYREFSISFRGNELGIAVFFSVWLVWIAIGALLSGLLSTHLRTFNAFLPLTLSYPFVVALQGYLLLNMRPLCGLAAFQVMPLDTLIFATAVLNAPVSLLTGFLFPIGCRYFQEVDRATTNTGLEAARLYAFEALGSFLGGVGVTIALSGSCSAITILLIASGLLGLAVLLASHGTFFYAKPQTKKKKRLEKGRWPKQWVGRLSIWISILLIILCVVGLLPGNRIRMNESWATLRWQTILPDSVLVDSFETPYQQVMVVKLSQTTAFICNGEVVASTSDEQTHAVTAALLAGQRPNAKSILILGLGVEGLIESLLRYDPEKLDVITIDETYHREVLPYYDDAVRESLKDERVTVMFDDAREFMTQKAQQQIHYDLIYISLPDPETALTNRYYTMDFYALAKTLLSSDGVLATNITLGENYLGPELLLYGRSVFFSLQTVFERVVVTPGETAWFFASPSFHQVTLDPTILRHRYSELSQRDERIPVEFFESIATGERLADIERALQAEPDSGLLNRDLQPTTLFLSLLVYASKSSQSLADAMHTARQSGLVLFCVPLFVFVGLRLGQRFLSPKRKRGLSSASNVMRFNGAVVVSLYGMLSMSLSIHLLLGFQNRFGNLFILIGLLSSLFMFGLFLGGLIGRRLLDQFQQWNLGIIHACNVLLLCFCFTLPWMIGLFNTLTPQNATVLYHLVFVLTGALCGVGFPAAGRLLGMGEKYNGATAAMFESLDHWGGAVGAAFVGILVIPVLGLENSVLLLMIAIAGVECLLIFERLREFAESSDQPGVKSFVSKVDGLRGRHHSPARPLQLLVLGLVLTALIIGNLLDSTNTQHRVHLNTQWLASHFEAYEVKEVEQPFVHYLLYAENEDFQKVVSMSNAMTTDNQGYGGPMNLLLAVDRLGNILEVRLVQSNETPSYIHGIDSWLDQFKGWPMGKPLYLEHEEIDTLTGATVTSHAVVDILNRCRVQLATEVLNLDIQAHEKPWYSALSIEVLVLIAALVAAVVLFLTVGQRARLSLLFGSLIVLGVATNQQLSTTHVMRLFHLDFPSSSSLEVFVLLVGIIGISAILGQMYCGYLCPFGAAQELLSRLGLIRQPNQEGARLRWTKYGVLCIIALIALFAPDEQSIWMDPLTYAFGGDYTASQLILLGLIAIMSLFFFRFWCRFLCPVGAFLSLFNRLNIGLRWARQKAYAKCDLGVRNREQFDCIQCNRCLDANKPTPRQMNDLPVTISKLLISLMPKSAERQKKGVRTSRETRLAKTWTAVLIGAIVLSLLLGFYADTLRGAIQEDASRHHSLGEPQDVDPEQILKQIHQHQLSDREAMFYETFKAKEKESVIEDSPLLHFKTQ